MKRRNFIGLITLAVTTPLVLIKPRVKTVPTGPEEIIELQANEHFTLDVEFTKGNKSTIYIGMLSSFEEDF